MKLESNLFIKANELEWESVAPGMKRKFMGYNEEIMMIQVKFDKGGIGARHKHRHSQTTYIVNGKFEVNIANKSKILSAGDGFYIPPNIEHGVVCLEEGILVDVFSPIREDFIANISGNSK